MQAQALLPIGEIAGNLKAIQSDPRTPGGKSATGFAIMLKSANKVFQKLSDVAATASTEGAVIRVGIILPQLGTDTAAKDPGPLNTDVTKPEISDAVLTGLFALQPVRTEFTPGEAQTQGVPVNSGTAEPNQGLVDGVYQRAAPEHEKILSALSQNGENFSGLHREANRETTSGAIWKLNQAAETANGQKPEQVWQAEGPSRGNPTGASTKLPTPGNVELLQPQQLIAAEMEKHHGVKLAVPATNNGAEVEKQNGVKAPLLAGNDGITTETPQSPINLTPNELTAFEKAPVSQEKVSTQDIINQVVRKIEIFTGPKSKTVSIKLEPEFLGRLQINLEVVDDVLIARFSTDNLQVKQLLESGIGQLRSQLEASGIRLEKAEVNIDLGHYFGEYQNPNETGHQNRQYAPYGATSFYGETVIGDSVTQDMDGSSPVAGELHEGTVDYLI